MYLSQLYCSQYIYLHIILFLKDRLEMTVHAVPLEEAMESDVVQNGSVPVIFPESGDIALPTVRESQPGVALVDLTQQTLREIVLPQ